MCVITREREREREKERERERERESVMQSGIIGLFFFEKNDNN